ncbi:MAG: galactose oxidase early set domain-containing protein, partial [Pseudomonadota bacterium]
WSDIDGQIGGGFFGNRHGANGGLVAAWNPYFNIAMMPGDGRILHLGGPSHLVAADPVGDGGAEYFNAREDIVRYYGIHQIYGNGKVLLAGGGSYQHRYGSTGNAWYGAMSLPNSAEIIDMNGDGPTSERTGDMQEGRIRGTSTLLADGSVMVVGGHDQKVSQSYEDSAIRPYDWATVKMRPEVWDPDTGVWSEMAPAQRRRQYHSTATLLPDGRVMAAGSGYPRQWQHATDFPNNSGYQPWDDYSYEIFEPAYLFDENGNYADRPEISWAPASVGYQHEFNLNISSPNGDIERMHLIRLSSQTHGIEMSARLVELEFTHTGGGNYVVEGLEDSTIAPAGFYQLIAIDEEGVPSVAEMVKVDGHLSIHVVSEPTGDALSRVSETFVANEPVGTAVFDHGNPLQSWQMHHGAWSGDGYRFLSRYDGMAMDIRFVTGWRDHSVLNTQRPRVDAVSLQNQTISVGEVEDGVYRLDIDERAVNSFFTTNFRPNRNIGMDELFLNPFTGKPQHRYHLIPTDAPATIRLVETGGALTHAFGTLGEEDTEWHFIPSDDGFVKILTSKDGNDGLVLTNQGNLSLSNRFQADAWTDWEIEYLSYGQVRLIHVATGRALTAGTETTAASPWGSTVVSAPLPSDENLGQIWRIAN